MRARLTRNARSSQGHTIDALSGPSLEWANALMIIGLPNTDFRALRESPQGGGGAMGRRNKANARENAVHMAGLGGPDANALSGPGSGVRKILIVNVL